MNANCHSIKQIDVAALSSEPQFSDTVEYRSSLLVMYAGQRLAGGPRQSWPRATRVPAERAVAFAFVPRRSIYLRGVQRPTVRLHDRSSSVADAAVTRVRLSGTPVWTVKTDDHDGEVSISERDRRWRRAAYERTDYWSFIDAVRSKLRAIAYVSRVYNGTLQYNTEKQKFRSTSAVRNRCRPT